MEVVWWCLKWIIWTTSMTTILALPGSLVDEIKTNELQQQMNNNKVKRAHSVLEETIKDIPYYGKPTAIKRGANLKSPLSDWQHEQQIFYENPENLANIQSSLYNTDNIFDDKTLAEYEKGYHYGTNKEKLDEALENAVLKSELYGEPAAINQYRYYGNDDKKRRRRRRRDAKTPRITNRLKRDTDLTPEEILSILTLYENEHRPWRFDDFDKSNDQQQDDETWLDGPVYPQSMNRNNDIGPAYLYDEKRSGNSGRWGTLITDGEHKKRYMMAKKRRDDPTTKNSFYTLTQLLRNQPEPNLPVYHRLIL